MRVLGYGARKPAASLTPAQEDTQGYKLARGPSCALSVAAVWPAGGHNRVWNVHAGIVAIIKSKIKWLNKAGRQ
jgi:hypothetical protein